MRTEKLKAGQDAPEAAPCPCQCQRRLALDTDGKNLVFYEIASQQYGACRLQDPITFRKIALGLVTSALAPVDPNRPVAS